MDAIRQIIQKTVEAAAQTVADEIGRLQDRVSLSRYSTLTRLDAEGRVIWTDALQTALREHEIVVIPPSAGVYWIDASVCVPSRRRIEAAGATVRLVPGCRVLMLRNEHTHDGTHAPIDTSDRDACISIEGGSWEESSVRRGSYGSSGRFDESAAYHGVSTLFYFANLDGLSLRDITFRHTAGFSVQTGDLSNAVFENITFRECFADGLHLNGNSENILIRSVSGQVGDDLIALNMYDWLNSSVNFGPMKNVFIDGASLDASSPYHAFRIQPGRYRYDDGSVVDCSIRGMVIRSVTGILTFKMYFQTPAYTIGRDPEWGAIGSADDLYFENIAIDLDSPLDRMEPYMKSDPVRGHFGGFEINADIGRVVFENIRLTRYADRWPLSHLVVAGPKSVRRGDVEVFDPYLSSSVGTLEFRGVTVNGVRAENADELLHITAFDNVNGDGFSTGRGSVGEVSVVS